MALLKTKTTGALCKFKKWKATTGNPFGIILKYYKIFPFTFLAKLIKTLNKYNFCSLLFFFFIRIGNKEGGRI